MISRRTRPWFEHTLVATLATSMVLLSCTRNGTEFTSNGTADTPDPFPKRVLIVTGEDYSGHLWQQTTPILAAAIGEDPNLEVEVLDDLSLLGEEDLTRYAAVVLHFKNYDPEVPGRAAFNALSGFVEHGGGIVLVHFACGAFEEFKEEYEQLAGRVWFGPTPPPGEQQHDPYGAFTVELADADHPILRGLQSFDTTDELYTCLTGDVPITVLATARSKHNGKTYPMAFVVEGENRRVFQCVLGHDAAALSNERVGELYRRATAWAAGLSPTLKMTRQSTEHERPLEQMTDTPTEAH